MVLQIIKILYIFLKHFPEWFFVESKKRTFIFKWLIFYLQIKLYIFLPVAHMLSAGVVHFDYDEDVLKVRPYVLGCERKSSWFLENDGDNVIPNVPLPQ